jgi:hypothetical protein
MWSKTGRWTKYFVLRNLKNPRERQTRKKKNTHYSKNGKQRDVLKDIVVKYVDTN